jgi:hypothetical protein
VQLLRRGLTSFAVPRERRSAVHERLALMGEGADWVEALLVACSPSLRGELRSIHRERALGSRDDEAGGARVWSHVLPDSNDDLALQSGKVKSLPRRAEGLISSTAAPDPLHDCLHQGRVSDTR